ncbi:hypothetical protein [Ferruginibacter sp. HRS2-29]|uniref:hypothetical protein n=1 Tax=Ferruginibacter sp. HRS2-29 TaxID=2487334 RepID=UPI0020CC11BA|nr:hypothetical protein [Ferruginibacter sp. HRS2-29]MCP9750250.1 hypothetical protein [Ferruginibacter sp. HRS2-29]
MTRARDNFNGAFFKWRFLIALLLSAVILFLNSCSKKDINGITGNTLEDYFESNILNRDFVVDLAIDTANDITAQYNGYVFRLFKNTLYDGPMTGIRGGNTYTGTWSSNSDYSKLTININQAPVPAEFTFINRSWRFISKDLPVMKLSPWGSTDPKILHMRRL